jgi:chromosome segregation ATPase
MLQEQLALKDAMLAEIKEESQAKIQEIQQGSELEIEILKQEIKIADQSCRDVKTKLNEAIAMQEYLENEIIDLESRQEGYQVTITSPVDRS